MAKKEEQIEIDESLIWRRFRPDPFFWSVVASAVIHLGFALITQLEFQYESDLDADIEWLQNFDELEGIGHGGRFAKLEVPPEPEPEVETEPEPEPEEEPEPVEEPEPEPEPEPEKKPEPKKEPKEVAKKPDTEKKPAEPKKPEKPKKPQNAFQGKELPGLDRSGPNDLPSMEGYGPGNAIFTALVRFDRVRGTSFEEPTRKILQNVPDYRIVLENSDVDPVTDLDSMFMASAAPQYLQRTFLAIRHKLPNKELESKLDYRFANSEPMKWRKFNKTKVRDLVPKDSRYQDPRKIMLADDGLALIARPEWMKELTTELPDDSDMLAGAEAGYQPSTMLDGLREIERAAPDDTLVLISAHSAVSIIPGVGRVRFESAKVSIRNIDKPTLDIDMKLGEAKDAERFVGKCPAMKKQLIGRMPFLVKGMVANLVNRLTCKAVGDYVTIHGEYKAEELEQVLNLALPLIPRPPALMDLPPGPLPKPKPAQKPPNQEAQPTDQPDMAPDASLPESKNQEPKTENQEPIRQPAAPAPDMN